MKSHSAYTGDKASNYDENAAFEKGNRDLHKLWLEDILSFIDHTPAHFIELGCGTGFFTETFYRYFPGISGQLIDGAEAMLSQAKAKFEGKGLQAEFILSRFEEIDFSTLHQPVDIVFSCLAIHHLTDADKALLYKKIYGQLQPGGMFILFDLFRTEDSYTNRLLEHIACRDIQRKLKTMMGLDDVDIELEELRLDNIIANDRREKDREGDQESVLADTCRFLAEAGFTQVIPTAQENRFISLLALK